MSPPQTKKSSCDNLSGSNTTKAAQPKAANGKIPREPKPIVLSSHRYDKILNNASGIDSKKQQMLDNEKKQLAELKAGNDKLVANFKGNMQRTQEQKIQQLKEDLDRKTQFAIDSFEQTKENEAQKRREKIAKAQHLVENLKPGPRELRSAVLQSEVLRVRNVQREVNHEFKKAVKKQECETKVRCSGQAMTWLQEEQKRMVERQKNENLYKRELLQTIQDNQRHRAEQRKQMIKEQQAARDSNDAEIRGQIEREKALMEKKRETLRKNALEAMKMVQQRRMRDNLCHQVEDRVCCVYNAGKHEMNTLVEGQAQQLATNRQNKIEAEVKKLEAIEDKTLAVETERVRRDITTMQLKFTAEEQEKLRRDKAAKEVRIKAYLREVEEEKEARRRAEELKRFEMAERYKNEEVNCMFLQDEQQGRIANAMNVRTTLDKQIQDNDRKKLAAKQANISCSDDVVEKEHAFFFEYARDLMNDAQQKGRPLYPFVKVVQQYKRDNQIDCERKVPSHMETNITIGRSSDELANKKDPNWARASILKNCLKIDEIILKSKNEEDIPLDSLKVAKAGTKFPNPKFCSASAECASIASSSKMRYSMQDLKKLNQYAGPSCH